MKKQRAKKQKFEDMAHLNVGMGLLAADGQQAVTEGDSDDDEWTLLPSSSSNKTPVPSSSSKKTPSSQKKSPLGLGGLPFEGDSINQLISSSETRDKRRELAAAQHKEEDRKEKVLDRDHDLKMLSLQKQDQLDLAKAIGLSLVDSVRVGVSAYNAKSPAEVYQNAVTNNAAMLASGALTKEQYDEIMKIEFDKYMKKIKEN